MNQDVDDDDDDDVDFNLGGGSAQNIPAGYSEGAATPPPFGTVHKASAKEDG